MKTTGLGFIVAFFILAITAQAQWTGSPGNYDVNGDLRVRDDLSVLGDAGISGDATVSDDATIGDDAAIGGNATVAGFVIQTATSLSVTNRALVTPTASVMLLTASDVNGGGPITNTIAAPGAGLVGAMVTFINAGPTNIVLTDVAGTANQSGDTTLGTDDAVPLYAVTALKWVQVAVESDN